MSALFIRLHLGAGDAIISNALIRHFASKYDAVHIPVRKQNEVSVRFMLRDLHAVKCWPVGNGSDADAEADEIYKALNPYGTDFLGMGFYSGKPFDVNRWDSLFYEQAGLPRQLRWDGFHVERDPPREIAPPREPYLFFHEDKGRGIKLDRMRYFRRSLKCVEADPRLTPNIFDWCTVIENSTELHLCDSAFACLADSLTELKANRLCVHKYARASVPPRYRHRWEVLNRRPGEKWGIP